MYGLRLRLEYHDFEGILNRLDILQRGYTGNADVRILEGTEPLKINYGDRSGDELPTIYGSEAVLQFFAEFDFEFQYMFTADSKAIRLDHYYDGSLFWSGFHAPEDWSEPLTAVPYQVSATFTDGLGALTNETFPVFAPDQRRTILHIVAIILEQTGLSLPVNTCVDWKEVQQAAGTDPLVEHYKTVSNLAGLESFEILEQLLPGCRLFQRLGQWWIISYSALKTDTITCKTYQYSNTTGEITLIDAAKTVSVKAGGYWIEDEPSMEMLPALKQLIVVQDFGYNENLVENGSFVNFDEVTSQFENWTNINVTPQQRNFDKNGGKYAYLPGKQAPGFPFPEYGLITNGIRKQFPISQTESLLSIAIDYALLGTRYSSLMFVGIRVVSDSGIWYLRRKDYVLKDPEFQWRNLNDKPSPGDAHITLGSHLEKSNDIHIINEDGIPQLAYYNTYDLVTAYPFDQVTDHFTTFKASVTGVPATGMLEIYLYVPYTNREQITGSCYREVQVELLNEEAERYPLQKSFKVINNLANNYKPDDKTIIVGDYPTLQNAEIMYNNGFQRADKTHTTAWTIPGAASSYSFAELIGRLIAVQQVAPREVYSIRLKNLTPSLRIIIDDITASGKRLIENGIEYDGSMITVEGNYTELPVNSIDIFTVEVATQFEDSGKSTSSGGSSSSSSSGGSSSGSITDEKVIIVDSNSTRVSAPGYLNAEYFNSEIDPETGVTRVNIKDEKYWQKTELVRDAENYLSVEGAKTKAGYADDSGLLNGLADTKFLRKDIDQEVAAKTAWQDLLTALFGFKAGLAGNVYLEMISDLVALKKSMGTAAFQAGFAGSGWKMDIADNRLTVDNLTVRKSMEVYELIINQIRATNGSLWVSDSAKISAVTDGGTYWKCFIDTDGGNNLPPFVPDDWIRCQKWTGRGVKYYSAKVTSVGADYFNVSKTGVDGAGIPETGDSIVRIGNATDASRQGAIYMTSSDNNSPYLDVLDGVNSASLEGKTKVRLGRLDGITDPQFGALQDYGLYADNVYLKGKIQVTGGNAETLSGSQAKADAAQAAASADATAKANAAYANSQAFANAIKTDLQSQIDGNITSWFFDYEPTMDNIPASGWVQEGVREIHLGDLFYWTSKGWSYRFQKVGTVYSWTRIADTDVTKALADAAAAQDTADSKRRVFTSQPVTPYDQGDLWTQGASGEILTCNVPRAIGVFVASDWGKAAKWTDDTAVENLQIGGANLIRKDYFDTSCWSTGGSSGYFTPNYSAGYKNTDAILFSCVGAYNFRMSLIRVISEESYYNVSFFYKYLSAGSSTYPQINDISLDNSIAYADGSWKYFSGKVFVNNLVGVHGFLDFQFIDSVDILLSDIKVEKGTKATDFSLSIEDVNDYATAQAIAAQTAAEAYALAKANLAETTAKAHADGIVTAEETRAINDATAKADAAQANAVATAAADASAKVNNLQVGGRNLFVGSKNSSTAMGLWGASGTATVEQFDLSPTYELVHYSNIVRTIQNYVLIRDLMGVHPSFGLDTNQIYTLSFWAKANVPQTVVCGYSGTEIEYVNNQITTEFSRIVIRFRFSVPRVSSPHYNAHTMLFGDGLTDLWIYGYQIEKGNKATDWTPAPEDVDAKIAEADYLKTALEGSTEISGGLVATNVLLMKDSAGTTRGGMSGLANDNVGMWTGGTYAEAIAATAKNILFKNGSFRLAGGDVVYDINQLALTISALIRTSATGARVEISKESNSITIYDANNVARMKFAPKNVMAFSDIGGATATTTLTYPAHSNNVTGSGTVNIGSSELLVLDTTKYYDITTPVVDYDLYALGYYNGTTKERETGYASVDVRLVDTLKNTIVWSRMENVSSGTANQAVKTGSIQSVLIPALPGSTYRIDVYLHCDTEAGNFADASAFASIGAGQTLAGTTMVNFSEMGYDGFNFINDSTHYLHYGPDIFAYKGALNFPGVLASGSVASGTTHTNKWGAKVASSGQPVTKGGTGIYNVPHNLGSNAYTVHPTPTTDSIDCRVTSKTDTYFQVTCRNTSNTLTDASFDYVMIGNN